MRRMPATGWAGLSDTLLLMSPMRLPAENVISLVRNLPRQSRCQQALPHRHALVLPLSATSRQAMQILTLPKPTMGLRPDPTSCNVHPAMRHSRRAVRFPISLVSGAQLTCHPMAARIATLRQVLLTHTAGCRGAAQLQVRPAITPQVIRPHRLELQVNIVLPATHLPAPPLCLIPLPHRA